MTEIDIKEKQGYAEKAREWQKKGGIMKYLISNEPGFREFFYDEMIKKGIPVSAFVGRMMEKFPKLDAELYPSEVTIYNFKRKLKKDLENEDKIGLAMKSEIKILETMDGFNYFEERKAIYDKCCMAVDIAEKAIAHIVDLMDRTKLPPQPLWEALVKLKELLQARSEHLDELDKLSVRFGLMPAREERNIIFAQQNNIMMNDEQIDVMGKIGLKVEDFEDGNLEKTMQKVMTYYSKQYGIGESKSITDGSVVNGEVIDSQTITDNKQTEGVGNDNPNGEGKMGGEEKVMV